jgi:hypothetical protein
MHNLALLLMIGIGICLVAYHFYLIGYNTGVEEVLDAIDEGEELKDAKT